MRSSATHSPLVYLLLFAVGVVAGTLNVIGGGGSMLTLPLMIFLGLPAGVANGTNRIAILVQNIGAVWSFKRHGVLEAGWVPITAVPAALGAILGAWAAVEMGDRDFQRALAALMVVVSLLAFWNPFRTRGEHEPSGPKRQEHKLALGAAFFVVGAYGGFVQAGVGFLLLAAMSFAGLDLVRGNALKVLIVLVYTPLVLALFGLSGKVDWGLGIALAAGNLVGGLFGVRLTILKGQRWIKRVVTVAVIAFAIVLWISP